jgi:hypothetical protein
MHHLPAFRPTSDVLGLKIDPICFDRLCEFRTLAA